MNIKKYVSFLPVILAAAFLTGCASPAYVPPAAEETAAVLPAPEETPEELPLLDLNSSSAMPAQAIWTEPGQFQIIAAGTYRLTGSLEGRITVDADGPVELILEGVSLTGESCLNVLSGDPVTLYGAAGTENVFTDVLPAFASGEASSSEPSAETVTETDAEDEVEAENTDALAEEAEDTSGAVITSKAPLLLGGGSVTVKANVNNGIRAKNGFTLLAGTLTVTAANHGVRARGGVTVLGGSLTVTAGGDAICADAGRVTAGSVELLGGRVALFADGRGVDAENDVLLSGGGVTIVSEDDAMRADGVTVSGGELTIATQRDGIQAGSDLTVTGGILAITTGEGGGAAIQHAGESFGPWAQFSAAEDSGSAKGLKSDGSVTITGGILDLHTDDDSIHCATVCTVDGGTINIISSDDGIHADDMLVIRDGTINLLDCFEGLEAFAVELHGGDVYIRSVNDGINANGAERMFRRGSDTEETEITSASGSSTTYFWMSGGALDLAVTGNASNMGDGVDSNGAVYITGGTAVVSTFGSIMENGLDTGWGGPVVTGGAVIAGGSSAMAESFSSSSTQCCAVVSMSYMPDGTEVAILDEDGSVIWSVTLRDGFSCLQVSHPDMLPGHVYTLAYGDQSTVLDFTDTTNIENSRGFGGFPGRW